MATTYYAVVPLGGTVEKPDLLFRVRETETTHTMARFNGKRWVQDNNLLRYFTGDEDNAEEIDEETAKKLEAYFANL